MKSPQHTQASEREHIPTEALMRQFAEERPITYFVTKAGYVYPSDPVSSPDDGKHRHAKFSCRSASDFERALTDIKETLRRYPDENVALPTRKGQHVNVLYFEAASEAEEATSKSEAVPPVLQLGDGQRVGDAYRQVVEDNGESQLVLRRRVRGKIRRFDVRGNLLEE